MLRILSALMLVGIASASLAQSTQSEQTTPSIKPSDTPVVTPSQTPAVTPSQTPSVTPSTGAPIVGGAAPAPVIEQRSVGGLSKCENALAFEREKCLQDERAAAGGSMAPQNTAPAPQNTAPAPQNTAPAGTVR